MGWFMYVHILLCDLTRAWWLYGVRFVVRMLVVGGEGECEGNRGLGSMRLVWSSRVRY